MFAFPSGIIENKNINHVILELNKIISDKEVDLILIGVPYNPNSKNKTMENIVFEFIKKLKKAISIPVETIDERLSSFLALENLKSTGIRNIKRFVDTEAARLMLEECLQKYENEKN